MAATTVDFELEIVNFPPTERGLCAAPAYRLRQNYNRGMADPAAHNVALANPRHVDALARNGKTASFAAITTAGGGGGGTFGGIGFSALANSRAVYPGTDLTGDFTMVWYGRLNVDDVFQLLMSGETAADVSNWSFSRGGTGGFWAANSVTHTRKASGVDDMVWTPADTFKVAGGDTLLFVAKTGGGGQFPIAYSYQGAGLAAAMVAQNLNAQFLNGDALGAGSKTCLGQFQGASDSLNGRIYLAGLFNSKLTGAQMNGVAAAKTTASLKALGPAWLVDASDQLATDLSGNGKHRTLLTGASLVTPPAGWTYG